jgi:subtilisin family serine protease
VRFEPYISARLGQRAEKFRAPVFTSSTFFRFYFFFQGCIQEDVTSVWNKLDSALAAIYLNYLKSREGDANAAARLHPTVARTGRIHVTLLYSGSLSEIESLGFRTVRDHGEGRADGELDLSNLERLAAVPGVRKLSFGIKPRPNLDMSIPQIEARPGAWDFSAGAFSGTTGAGVIVGIIDTGIDFQHPFFLKSDAPKTTRILRIWDMGLQPRVGESSPALALLSGGAVAGTYGVEYTDAMINQVLRGVVGATPVRHRDCNGHGTHVASTAAGDGRPAHTYIGVAPEADIIVVKYFFLQNDPKIGGTLVGEHQQKADAVSYILNVAKTVLVARPVVINCSFGDLTGPHDGFTEDEVWLTAKFAGATGTALVASAGNEGGGTLDPVTLHQVGQQHVRIDFPVGGDTVEVPFELYDPRTNRSDHDTCVWQDATDDLWIELYYPNAGPTVSAELKLPPGSGAPGFIAGPTLGGSPVSGSFRRRTYTLNHAVDVSPLPAVTRNHISVRIEPFPKPITSGKVHPRHVVGRYVVRVTASNQVTVHVWCSHGSGFGFEIRTNPALPPIVKIDDLNQIGNPGGAGNIITAAAYSAEDTPWLPVGAFSSRGPLVNYNYAAGIVQPDKPDLAAPGIDIDAAKSTYTVPQRPGLTTQMTGTSMAAPHITGAVALLLQKNKNLTVAQIISTLKTLTVIPVEPPETVGSGRLDVKDALDNVPP